MPSDEHIWLRETYINRTKDSIFGENEPYETPYTHDEAGQLFRSLRNEYGRCIGPVFATTKNEDGIPIGWVFEKRMEYEDYDKRRNNERFYIREVWCTLYAQQPVRGVSRQNRHLRIDTRKVA